MINTNISILDCTLRDGGYVNNWSFSVQESKTIIDELVKANLEIIEVGFLQDKLYSLDKTIFNNVENIKNIAPKTKNKSMYAAMIALGKNEINLEKIKKNNGILDIIRITFHLNKEEKSKAFRYCSNLIKKGYKVCLQPVGSSQFSNNELTKLISEINKLKPYAFYLVDTLGVLTPGQLNEKMSLIDKYLGKNIKIGFHSHNNLQLSFANSISLLNKNYSHDLIIDSSLMGMGRGAGNLPTELITNYLNGVRLKKYNTKHILKLVDEIISPLKNQFMWGYNAYYYLSAKNNCHPDYASYLLNKQTLPVTQVDDLLNKIPLKDKSVFNKELIKKLYFNCQINSSIGNKSYINLKKQLFKKKILLLGPGSSINNETKIIERFVKENKPIIISVNSIIDKFGLDYLFVSNRKRYNELIFPIKYKTIFTSNLPDTFKSTYVADYNALIIKEDEGDNALIILINLLKLLKCKEVYVAGFDGFKLGNNNYYNKKHILVNDEDELNLKNRKIKDLIHKSSKKIEVISLTTSKYF